MTEPTYISELEKASLKLQELTEQTKEKAEQFYLEMPELEEFTEIEQQVDSLRRAAVTMSKAMAQTYVISAELSVRCRDMEKQRKNGALCRQLLQTLP